MLISFISKQKINLISLEKDIIVKKNHEIKTISPEFEYNNIRYSPSSSKEWLDSVYCYNKQSSVKLIHCFMQLYTSFKSYSNMFLDKTKNLYKRRRHNKVRYSANKIYTSRPELEHSNTKVSIILYIFNKQNLYHMKNLKYIFILKKFHKMYIGNFKEIKWIPYHINRLFHALKTKCFAFTAWMGKWFESRSTRVVPISANKYRSQPYNLIKFAKKILKTIESFYFTKKWIHFNYFKFNGIRLNYGKLGFSFIVNKIYNKTTLLYVVSQKAIFLNSDLFSSAVVLKLRDRHKRVVRILRKAIIKRTWLPDLHSLITFDECNPKMSKYNIISTIIQQTVSGVRFIASGRLTLRLTAMRAIVKKRYTGSSKNIRASFNSLASVLLRGFAKANVQCIQIDAKTANGTFGVTTWLSSHNFIPNSFYMLPSNSISIFKQLLKKVNMDKKQVNQILSFIILLVFLLIIPGLLVISLDLYIQGIIAVISICYFLCLNYLFYMDKSAETNLIYIYNIVGGDKLAILFSNLQTVITSIADASVLSDKVTILFIFIGLIMLFIPLLINNKNPIPLLDKLFYIWKNLRMFLYIILMMWTAFFILGNFGLFLLNKQTFVCFVLTVFSRIAFIRLLIGVTVNIVKVTILNKDIDLHLFSLHPITVLLIIGIVYINVVFIVPIFYSTFYLFIADSDISLEDYSNNVRNSLETSITKCHNDFSLIIEGLHLEKFVIGGTYNNLSSSIMSYVFDYILPEPIHCASPKQATEAFSKGNKVVTVSRAGNTGYIDPNSVENNTADAGEGSSSNNNSSSATRKNPVRGLKRKMNNISLDDHQDSDFDDRPKKRVKKTYNKKKYFAEYYQKNKNRLTEIRNNKTDEEKAKSLEKLKQWRDKRKTKTLEKNNEEHLKNMKKMGLNPENALNLSNIHVKGVSTKSIPVWIEDLEGKKIKHFPSTGKCAEELKISRQSVSSALNLGTVVLNKYKIKNITIFDQDISDKQRKEMTVNTDKGIAVSLINSKGKIDVFGTMTLAAEFLKISQPNLSETYLDKNVGYRMGNEVYTIRKGVILPSDLSKEVSQEVKVINKKMSISVTDFTGKTTIFPGITAVSKHFGTSKNYLTQYILDKNVGFHHETGLYLIRKGDFSEGLSLEAFNNMEIKSNKTIVSATDANGYTKVFKSVKDATIYFGKNPKNRIFSKENIISLQKDTKLYTIVRENVSDQNAVYTNNKTSIIMMAHKGKYLMEFSSLKDTCKYLEINTKEIKHIVDKKASIVIKDEFYSFWNREDNRNLCSLAITEI